MGKVNRIEDLRCWQMAIQLCAKCYQMCDKGQLAKDFDTRSQFRSAALSVMNNIAEGFGPYSTKEFVRFLDYSAGSCTEVKSMTCVMMDIGYFDQDFIIELQKYIEAVKASTLALIKYLRSVENL